MTKWGKGAAIIALVGFGVAGRILPHAWNFTPIAAIGLVSGYYLNWKWSIAIVVASMLIGDFWLGTYGFGLMMAVYGSLGAIAAASKLLAGKLNVQNTILAALAASSFFYLTTNLAVWGFSVWYPKTLGGLIQCYILALPFFKNALLGDVFYTLSLFAAAETIRLVLSRRQTGTSERGLIEHEAA